MIRYSTGTRSIESARGIAWRTTDSLASCDSSRARPDAGWRSETLRHGEMPESPIANDALATSRLQPGCSRRQAIENVHFRAGNLIRRRRNDDMNDVMRRGYDTK